MVQEVLHLEPSHAPAQSLASRIADRKREDFIAWSLAQARRMQTDGDLDGAMDVVAQGLGAYPNEPRLQQLQSTLQRALAEKQRQATRIAPRTTANVPGLAVPTPPTAETPLASVREAQTVELPAALSQEPTAQAPPVAPTLASQETSPGGTLPQREIELPPLPPPVVPRPPRPGPSKTLLLGTAAAVAMLLLIAAIVTSIHRRKAVPVTPAADTYAIMVHSTPEGAEIKVSGNACGTTTCRMDLAPGNYQAQAQLTGYQSVTSSFAVGVGLNTDIALVLSPLVL